MADNVEVTVHRDAAQVKAEQQAEVFIVLHRRLGDDRDAHPLADRVLDAVRVVELRGNFELADVDEATAREALRLASHKLPVRCKFVKREELDTVKEGDAE